MDKELADQLKRVLTSLERLLPRSTSPVVWSENVAAIWRRQALGGYLEPVQGGRRYGLTTCSASNGKRTWWWRTPASSWRATRPTMSSSGGRGGTGKSSLVRALLHAYADQGLRVVQVDKSDLVNLPDIVDQIRNEPYRFIIFADDVSFETGESSYKVLKSALDGSVFAPSDNVIIYVTSNRRHLLPEYESDNRGAMLVNNEIHHGESVEEKISLSGRFGLWVGFHPFTQDQYVEVTRLWVERLCSLHGVTCEWSNELAKEAIDWSHVKGDRSGRISWQFANQWVGRVMLKRAGGG